LQELHLLRFALPEWQAVGRRSAREHHDAIAARSTSLSLRATIASSPGCNIHTPTTIVFGPPGNPALAGFPPVEGFSSILGFPSRIFCATSVPVILRPFVS